MKREKVSFVAGADACAGYLFVPEAAAGTETGWPCVVLAHGFSATMDRLVPHAERFAAGGLAALVLDHRGFGESGGQPRQAVDLPTQHEDLRAAIAWVRGHHDRDPGRVALWGNSLGGVHVISVAADDPGIAAVVAQIPFNGFPRVRDRSAAASLRLLVAMLWDALRGKLGLSPAYIPMIGRPGQVAVVSTTETPEAMTRELADRAPHGTLRRYSGTQFDFYSDRSVSDRALADQLGFLHEHLHISPRAA